MTRCVRCVSHGKGLALFGWGGELIAAPLPPLGRHLVDGEQERLNALTFGFGRPLVAETAEDVAAQDG